MSPNNLFFCRLIFTCVEITSTLFCYFLFGSRGYEALPPDHSFCRADTTGLKMAYQLYRNTTIGHTLQESLDEFVSSGQISNGLSQKVMLQFDKAINNALANRVKSRLTFKAGHLKTYRFCDNVWTFVLKDVEFREVQELIKIDKVKIVACDGKSSQQQKDAERD